MLADYAENYSMVVQDAVQGWYWTKQQCTTHPLVLYYKTAQEKLVVQSLYDLEHDTGFVYELQKLQCNYLRLSYPGISNIQCSSDGCLAQNKNYKNFLNLTFHK